MRPSKLSFLLILIMSALLLSGASKSDEVTKPKKPEPQSKKAEIYQKPTKKQATPTSQTVPVEKFSGSHAGQPQPKNQASKQKTEPQPPVNSTWWFRFFIVLFTGCLVIIGGIQAYIYRQQTRHMRISERAWIGVSFDQVYTLGGLFIDLKISNTGKSPGHIKKTELIDFKVTDRDKPVPYKPKSALPPEMGTAWTIFPGERTTQRWDVRLEPEEITEVAKKTKKLTLFGFVCYDDIFGNGHVTNFYRDWMEVDGPLNGRFMIPPDAEPGQNEAT